ncbi:MAG: indole-3-glycerol phosphate synthase TrpC [Magnetospirillum sp. WYHS-4]
MTDVLTRICADKRDHVARKKRERSPADLEEAAQAAPKVRGFVANLVHEVGYDRYGLIAEIKKASPSKGLIRADFDPAALAKAYEKGGASCLSVLTDVPYFQGDDAYLGAARAACRLPVLRKDFMIDPYQVVEARALGADCILVIMAALSDAQAAELVAAAAGWGMDSLIEVHDEAEMERASRLRATLIGINNRNLKTLKVDLATTERLAPLAPPDRILVAESGLETPADLARMAKAGAKCFLIGESFMRQPDVEAAVKKLLAPQTG